MQDQIPVKMLINGQSLDSGTPTDVINPATEQAFATCYVGTAEDVDQAVKAARAAFPAWCALSDQARRESMMKIATLIEENMPELMTLITQENGKPMNGLQGVGSGMEVGGSIAWTQVAASIDMPIDLIQDDDMARVEVHRKPLGVIGSITPWNWPLLISIWHIIPALRTGNTVVIKPALTTPVATTRLVELANTVLPKGVLNIVHGQGEVGAAMSSHPGIDKLIFTGSTSTGQRIMAASSENLTRLTLELGGNDAGIILPGTNVEAIASTLFLSCFHNNGQTCAALKRLYVHESQYEEVCETLATMANTMTVGDGTEKDTDLGPLQNANQLKVVSTLVEDARANGGRILCGGERLDRSGYFYKPTVVADQTDGNRIVDEEQFGPALPVIKYSHVDDAVKRANACEAGLGGSVWGDDAQAAAEIGKQLECGSVWINDHGGLQPDAPFGGVKKSGFGVQFGLYGLNECTSIQTLKVLKS